MRVLFNRSGFILFAQCCTYRDLGHEISLLSSFLGV